MLGNKHNIIFQAKSEFNNVTNKYKGNYKLKCASKCDVNLPEQLLQLHILDFSVSFRRISSCVINEDFKIFKAKFACHSTS